ncbi:hypothetical protein JF568_11565 [Alysiella filiformis DSM 16848]|nr:hypothetical protein JF568_11565 [Alysiella filiformis DSM 16848]
MAYPTYQNFIIRSHIESARGEMMDNIKMMEEFYTKNRTMCGKTETDGTCSAMPTPVASTAADTYKISIKPDKFNGGGGNSYIIASEPNNEAKFSENTKTNKQVYLLYYSNGSGFVKCTKAGFEAALNAASSPNAGDGCSIM